EAVTLARLSFKGATFGKGAKLRGVAQVMSKGGIKKGRPLMVAPQRSGQACLAVRVMTRAPTRL
ncbi:hypothetical protein, partial [Candidatus Erwinia dacicola]